MSTTLMKYLIPFWLLFLLIFNSCSSPDRSAPNSAPNDSTYKIKQDASQSSHSEVIDILKSNFKVDSLKEVFSSRPFNFEFSNKETTIQETTDTWVKGNENDYDKYVDQPNELIITFDKGTRKVKKIVFYLSDFNTSNVKIRHLEKLFEFIDYFDPKASEFIVKNFHTLFYDEDAYDKLKPYENKEKNINMEIDHSLFSARIAEKKSKTVIANGEEYIDVTTQLSEQIIYKKGP